MTACRLVAAVVILTLQLGGSFPASASPGDSEETAIAELLAIGLTNAPTNFSAIRGDLAKQNAHTSSYKSTRLPDTVHYSSCFAYSVEPETTSDPVRWVYTCNSTPRNESTNALFDEIETIVRANLPPGYSSSGVKMTIPNASGSFPWETWTHATSADIILQVYPNEDGTARYILAVRQ